MINSECYLCGSSDIELIHEGTRDNPDINVLRCKKCGLVFLSTFDHVRNDFYENSGMHEQKKLDMSQWRESTLEDDLRRTELLKDTIKGKDILDFGCGNGGFLQHSKKYANKVRGIEIEKAAKEELVSSGYIVWEELKQCNEKFDIITLFHVLEHLEDPVDYLKEISEYLKKNNDSQIIVEVPNANDALLSIYECKEFADFTYWSPHLFLYNDTNIKTLASKSGLKVNWIKQIQRYSLANHLYWLSKGKPGGHKYWRFLNDSTLNECYKKSLDDMHACDTLLVSLISE